MSRITLLFGVLALVGLSLLLIVTLNGGGDPSLHGPEAVGPDGPDAAGSTDPGRSPDRTAGDPREMPGAASAHRVAGQVVDEEGTPLLGVLLELGPVAEPEADSPRGFTPGRGGRNPGLDILDRRARNWSSNAVTGKDGRFSVVPGGEGPFRLLARLAGFGTEELRGLSVGGDELLIVLFPGARLKGLVVDADGRPVGQALARLGGESASAGPDGAFELDELPAGDRTLTVSAAAFTAKAVPVTLTAGETLDAGRIVLDAGPGITGTVLGPDDQPAATAQVRARQGLSDGGAGFTTADGTFRLGAPPPGTWRITAEHDEFGFVTLAGVQYAEGQRLTGLVLRMTAPGTIVGKATDTAGGPLAGVIIKAVVILDDSDFTPFTRSGQSGPDGTFRLTGVSGGAYDVTASLSGYVPARKTGVRVESGQETDVQFALGEGLAVSGRVLDRRGQPVAGVQVSQARESMIPMPGQPAMASTVSGADGSFTLGGLTEAVINLSAADARYGPAMVRGVQAGTDDVVLVMRDLGSISGIALAERSGRPLDHFEVESVPAASPFAGVPGFQAEGEVELLGEGRFQVSGLKPGTYRLSIYADEFAPGREAAVEVAEGEDTGGLEIRLTEGVVLRGTVVSDRENRPVPGAEVSADIAGIPLFSMMGLGRKKSATTDEEGRFTLPGLPDGTTTVKVTHPGYSERSLANVRLPTERDLEIRLLVGGTVIARVVNEAGDPVTEVMVVLQRQFPFSQSMGTTDASGSVVFERVPPGAYMVMRMNAAGLARRGLAGMDMQMETANVKDGEEVVVDLKERGGVTLSGRVERGGKPVAGVMVYLAGAGQTADAMRNMKFGASEANGSFTIDKVTPGAFTLMIMQPGTFTPGFSQPVTVGENGTSGVVVTLPSASIAGQVVGEDGKPVGGAQVLIVPGTAADFRTGSMQESMQAFAGMTNADGEGRFRLDDISPGTYVARAWQAGYGGIYSEPFTVPELGEGPADLRLVLPSGVGVLVRVKLANGKPVENGWVYVTDSEGKLVPVTVMQAAQTDTTGLVEVRLAPGRYRIEAQAPGHPAAFGEITVTGGAPLELELLVPEASRLTVVVVDGAGAAVEKVRVDLLDQDGRSVVRRTTGDFLQDSGDLTTTDAEGRISFPLLSAGTYQVVAEHGGATARGTVTISAGAGRELILTLK